MFVWDCKFIRRCIRHKHKIQKEKRKNTNLLKGIEIGGKARKILLHFQDSGASNIYSVMTQVDLPVLWRCTPRDHVQILGPEFETRLYEGSTALQEWNSNNFGNEKGWVRIWFAFKPSTQTLAIFAARSDAALFNVKQCQHHSKRQ